MAAAACRDQRHDTDVAFQGCPQRTVELRPVLVLSMARREGPVSYSQTLTQTRRRIFSIVIKTNSRDFKFRAKDSYECQKWIQAIKQHIHNSQGFIHKLPAPANEFWKEESLISDRQFMLRADTLDLLLFHSNSMDGRRIRDYSKCEYGK